MGNGCGSNGNCCDNNDVGDSNINMMAAGAAMMITMIAAAAAVATAVIMTVTMMVVAAVADARYLLSKLPNRMRTHTHL